MHITCTDLAAWDVRGAGGFPPRGKNICANPPSPPRPRVATHGRSARHYESPRLPKLSFFQTPSAGGWGGRPATTTPSVTATTKVSGEQDIEVQPGATDTVSALAFSPTADVLAASSWDSYTRIYRIDKTNAQPVQPWQQYNHEGPVMDVVFSGDGAKVISGGADKMARCFDLNTNQTSVVAQHDDTIRCVRWIQAFGGALVTAGWDRKVKVRGLSSASRADCAGVEDRPAADADHRARPARARVCDGRDRAAHHCGDRRAQDHCVPVQRGEWHGTDGCGPAEPAEIPDTRTRRAACRRRVCAGRQRGPCRRALLPRPAGPEGRQGEKVRVPLPPPRERGSPRRAAERDLPVSGELYRVQRAGHVCYRWG